MTDLAASETTPAPGPATLPELTARMADEMARLDVELGEVDLLIAQATTEAARHEARRTAAAEKLTTTEAGGTSGTETVDPAVTADLNAQLVTLTKRAALMESQVEVLTGKRRALGRYRDALAGYVEALGAFGDVPASDGAAKAAGGDTTGVSSGVSRLVLDAQEDLRREIAREMHDGPAQSLTNIVLQAQIVERLVDEDASRAGTEVRQLVAMVQQTLEATKTFIFDVRPMVLDDLGLVPTLRRAARERGRRSGVAVEFETLGADRRLSVDLESGLFRMLDEATSAYLTTRAELIVIRLDWSDQVEATVTATRPSKVAVPADSTPDVPVDKDLPPALAAMMEDRRADARDAAEAARRDAIVVLPPTAWREIQDRAATLGMRADLLDEGSKVRLVADLAPAGAPAAAG